MKKILSLCVVVAVFVLTFVSCSKAVKVIDAEKKVEAPITPQV
ncbi:hypothetical protein [Candidatus Endomicrobiellum trichonymphae]|nr:hypothetical protein [Candidatus Endomicrobium trichonymphae]